MADHPAKPLHFDRVARLYRWAEYLALGPLLQQTRRHFLSQLPHTGTALVLGDGDGRFTATLLRHRPHLHVIAVDSSQKMLHLLTQRCRFAAHRLQTLHRDLRNPQNLPKCDLVISHFVLDCLSPNDLTHLAQTLRQHVAPGALWLVSDFAIPPHHPWRLIGAAYIRLLYLAFRALTALEVQHLPPIHATLTATGWQLRAEHKRLHGLLFSAIWQAPLTPFQATDATTLTPPSSTQT